MRVARLIEAINLGVTKRQFSHQLVYKLMTAVHRISRQHNWSWLSRELTLTTQPMLKSAAADWSVALNASVLVEGSGAGDIPRSYTGGEVIIKSDAGTSWHRILRVGDRDDQTYAINNIYLDSRSKLAHTTNVEVWAFRREYCPVDGDVEIGMPAENLTGNLRIRGDNDPLTNVDADKHRRLYANATAESSTSTPEYYDVIYNVNVPAPRFAPEVTGNNVGGTKTPPSAGGTVFLACAYVDDEGMIKSPIGPITEYSLSPASAAGFQIEVEYGNESGVPEQSYKLALLVSPINPTGFDGAIPADKEFRRNESMIPFFEWGAHPFDTTTNGAGTKGGGAFPDIPMTDEEITVNPRWWPADNHTAVRFMEIPSAREDYIVEGKISHPWMAWINDNCLVPDEYHDALGLAVRSSIQGQEGLLAERRFQFTMRELRKRDRRKASTTAPEPIRYGYLDRVRDRYDLE